MTDDSYRFREYSGGCQCGAVRWHATELRDNPHFCHCRMCQKAAGNVFIDLVGIRHEHLTWTRGEPSEFNSSDVARPWLLQQLRHAALLSLAGRTARVDDHRLVR